MQLLRHLPVSSGCPTDMAAMLPRLWPFLRHAVTRVRVCVLECLQSLLAQPGQPAQWLTPALCTAALRLFFQNLLLEENLKVLAATQSAWAALLRAAPPAILAASLPMEAAAQLFLLASTPEGQAYDAGIMLHIPSPEQASMAGDGIAVPGLVPPVLGGEGLGDVLGMRIAAAQALGQLAAVLMHTGGANSPGTELIAASIACQQGRVAVMMSCLHCLTDEQLGTENVMAAFLVITGV